MKVKPIKLEEGNLYRHPAFAPPQEEKPLVKPEPNMTANRPNQVLRTRTEQLGGSFSAEFDDEFDGNLFDGVDVSEGHGDEFSFEAPSRTEATPKAIQGGHNQVHSGRTSPVRNNGAPRPQPARAQPNGQGNAQQHRPNPGPGGVPQSKPIQRQPQTPIQQQNPARPDQTRARMPPPNGDAQAASRGAGPQQNGQQPQNQPLRPTPPQPTSAPARPGQQPSGTTPANQPPNGRPTVGFVTSRAAELVQSADGATPLSNVPTFNPHVESPVPIEKRTPGFDHKRSAPVKRQEVGAPPAPPPAAQPASSRPTNQPAGRPSNFVNPQQDVNRRIGMPGGPNYAMSPSANRGAYKPPTFANGAAGGIKRERPPLQDVSNQGTNGVTSEGGDPKRQKVEPNTTTTGGMENTATATTAS